MLGVAIQKRLDRLLHGVSQIFIGQTHARMQTSPAQLSPLAGRSTSVLLVLE
jgi:hypothetical protein